MKLLLKISLVFIGVIGVIALASCEKDEVKSLVIGKIVATPSSVKNGDEITLEIGGNVSASGETIINGKDYHPIIHYLIDGKAVVKSSETTLPFNAKYILSSTYKCNFLGADNKQ